MDIPQKIRVMRKSEDLTQREFADMIGISYSALTSYEYGRNLPGLEITIKLFKHPRF
ncbi:helix-turn-helix transcriptional regulator, partial [Escherichia coli]|nr:helix-turn-helix transcriptional regulator [Escherichia coli]EET3035791.1 helix-turn-helix transcriptional regulator [Escherichia coli]EEU3707241.1 helix-turn-helix transcriptional regulator [Escherichia coli]EEV6593122.1 helix-turn-helix transcriptional regulator [Escherichia coli]EFL0114941.1 helix-turn-helix transcriptional regulator [Escherichia coli]